jgi:hypothetical protein
MRMVLAEGIEEEWGYSILPEGIKVKEECTGRMRYAWTHL